MEPVLIAPVQLLVDRFIGKKWKDFIAAVFESSAYGCARLELFASEAKLHAVEPSKVLLLGECVSIRTAFTEKDVRVIKVHMRDNTVYTITSRDFSQLRETLSKATFPHRYVTIQSRPSTSTESSPVSDSGNGEIFDKLPILLLPTTMSRAKRWRDGNYDLHFAEDTLNLELTGEVLDAWPYRSILWVATGERCLGFEIEDSGVFECACAAPQLAVDNFRNHVKFSTIFRPVQKKTLNTYNRNYTPLREETPLNTSSIAEDEEEYAEVIDSRASTNRTTDSGVSVGEKSLNPITKMVSNSMQELAVKEKPEEKKSFMKFFRRNSAKTRGEKGREAFEKNADNEWLHVPPPQKSIEDTSEVDRFKTELEAVVKCRELSTKTQATLQHRRVDFSLLDQELAKQFGNLPPSERSSIA
ncbi:unnamed protein product, partial [Mesorhabditis spiculigera]